MELGVIDGFSPRAQVWVFGAGRDLTEQEEQQIGAELGAFVRGWKAHEVPLRAAAAVLDHRFVIAAVDEQQSASGCSIDKLFGVMRSFEERFGTTLLDTAKIWFRRGNSVTSVSRDEFRKLGADGSVDADTLVYDFNVTSLEELRSEKFARPARDSWHARYLPVTV